MTLKNEDAWRSIEASRPFRDTAGPDGSRAWKWLEKLQAGGRFTKLEIIQLEGLLSAVYDIGKTDGASDAPQQE